MTKIACPLCATPAGTDQLVGEARDILLALAEKVERVEPDQTTILRELRRAIKVMERVLKT